MESLQRSGASSGLSSLSPAKGLKYGLIAGFIATWSISTAIAASEFELGLDIGTFYAVMGISMGLNDPVASAYFGFATHLVTGSVLGGVIGALAIKVERLRRSNMANILDPYRAVAMGAGTGILVWLVLFLPVTALLIQPSEVRINELLSSGRQTVLGGTGTGAPGIGESFQGIAISAILFHLVWGAIFGFIVNSLLRIRLALQDSEMKDGRVSLFSNASIRMAAFGLASGVIASLAISGLLLLAERTSSLPIGIFYYVLVSGLTDSYSANYSGAVAIGLGVHLLAGSFIGLVMSFPYILLAGGKADVHGTRKTFFSKYGPIYGMVFGFGLWLLVFMPVTYLAILPVLNSFENQDVAIGQQFPTGATTTASFFRLATMADQVIFGAIAFNMFYGLLVGIMMQSFFEKYTGKARPNESDEGQPESTSTQVT